MNTQTDRQYYASITAVLVIWMIVAGLCIWADLKEAKENNCTTWQSAAWIYRPDGSRVQFGLRNDGVVVWRKIPEEKP